MKKNSNKNLSVKAPGGSIIIVLAIVAVIVFFTITAVSAYIRNDEKSKYTEMQSNEISYYNERNSELINDLKDENASEILEEKALEEDYIYPGDRVYADSAK